MRLHLLFFFSFSLACLAQDTPWWEVQGGYQFTAYQPQQVQTASGLPAANAVPRLNMNGWNFSVQENVNSWFSGIVDFSGGYGSKKVIVPQPGAPLAVSNFKIFTWGGGAQFSYSKNERVQPFARIIFAAGDTFVNKKETALAIIGGGVDYRLKSYAFFRIAGDNIHTSIRVRTAFE